MNSVRVYPDVHVALAPALPDATMLAQAAQVVKRFGMILWKLLGRDLLPAARVRGSAYNAFEVLQGRSDFA